MKFPKLEDLVGEYTVKGDKVYIACPYCDDKKKHLVLFLNRGSYKCYRCGAHGISPFMRGTRRKSGGPFKMRVLPGKQIPGYAPLGTPGYCGYLQRDATEFLRHRIRPVDLDTAYEYELGVSPLEGLGVVIPYFENGPRRVVFYQTRMTHPANKVKYASPRMEDGWPGCSEVVFNLDRCSLGRPIVLVEGAFDAMACPFGAALSGHAMSMTQAYKVAALGPSDITFMMDGDQGQEGVEPAVALMRKVGYRGPIFNAIPPAGKDPGDLGRAACTALIKEAKTSGLRR